MVCSFSLGNGVCVRPQVINSFKQMLSDKHQVAVDLASGRKSRSHRWLNADEARKSSCRRSAANTLSSVSSRIEENDFTASPYTPLMPSLETYTPAEKMLVLKMVLKVSDIGNVSKGKEVCLLWTDRVMNEFMAQGDLEEELGLPVTPFMSRTNLNAPKQQSGFYSFVVRPMFLAMDQLISMEPMLKNISVMEEFWNGQIDPSEPHVLIPSKSPLPTSRSFTRCSKCSHRGKDGCGSGEEGTKP